jgi:hypothetical protein
VRPGRVGVGHDRPAQRAKGPLAACISRQLIRSVRTVLRNACMACVSGPSRPAASQLSTFACPRVTVGGRGARSCRHATFHRRRLSPQPDRADEQPAPAHTTLPQSRETRSEYAPRASRPSPSGFRDSARGVLADRTAMGDRHDHEPAGVRPRPRARTRSGRATRTGRCGRSRRTRARSTRAR